MIGQRFEISVFYPVRPLSHVVPDDFYDPNTGLHCIYAEVHPAGSCWRVDLWLEDMGKNNEEHLEHFPTISWQHFLSRTWRSAEEVLAFRHRWRLFNNRDSLLN